VRATLSDFVRVLRGVGVRISTSEVLDAYRSVESLGISDRDLLKSALGATLAKTSEEWELFGGCFDRFFAMQNMELDEKAANSNDGGGETSNDAPPPSSMPGGGGGGGAASDEELNLKTDFSSLSPLSQMLLDNNPEQLAVEISAAGQRVGVNDVANFTQRGRFVRSMAEALGLEGLDDDIARLDAGEPPGREVALRLEQARAQLFQRLVDFVEQRIALFASAEGDKIRRELLPRLKLSNIEKRQQEEMRKLVRKMAKRLVALYSRRRKVSRRGQLDLRKTLRGGQATGGLLFETHWKRKKIARPKVMAVCDVSGSVASVARFLMMFLYSVTEVLPKVRAFAFSSNLHEVTELFAEHDLEEGVATAIQRYGNMPTDYGRALADLKELCFDDIDRRTTLIILGDGRSNYGNPGAEILREMKERAGQVIWLNPEPRTLWGLGDSEMPAFLPACNRAEVCNTLKDLERVVGDLLRFA